MYGELSQRPLVRVIVVVLARLISTSSFTAYEVRSWLSELPSSSLPWRGCPCEREIKLITAFAWPGLIATGSSSHARFSPG
ncbi:hypothetical protein F4801DRAFT_527105 [Xylaria longipes]|nr:hypothetical protein F4801DRAFT_527105 [Xylaria longipes]